MHNWRISEHLQKIMKKLSKKDKSHYEQLLNKMDEIVKCDDFDYHDNIYSK